LTHQHALSLHGLTVRLPSSDEPSYAFNHLKPSFPEVDWPPIEPLDVIDRGLHAPSRSLGTKGKRENLVLKKAGKGKWSFITPALGVEIQGVDILKLTDEEKDDL
jgi:sulfonate dioxygenase